MSEELGRQVLASARFASFCGSKLVSIGHFRLRGFSQPQEIFALPPRIARPQAAARAAS
jgi:class 3 adenylate cyclase